MTYAWRARLWLWHESEVCARSWHSNRILWDRSDKRQASKHHWKNCTHVHLCLRTTNHGKGKQESLKLCHKWMLYNSQSAWCFFFLPPSTPNRSLFHSRKDIQTTFYPSAENAHHKCNYECSSLVCRGKSSSRHTRRHDFHLQFPNLCRRPRRKQCFINKKFITQHWHFDSLGDTESLSINFFMCLSAFICLFSTHFKVVFNGSLSQASPLDPWKMFPSEKDARGQKIQSTHNKHWISDGTGPRVHLEFLESRFSRVMSWKTAPNGKNNGTR